MAVRQDEREGNLEPFYEALKPFQDATLADKMAQRLATLSPLEQRQAIVKTLSVHDTDEGYVSPAGVFVLASLAMVNQTVFSRDEIMFHAASAAQKAAIWQQNILAGKIAMQTGGFSAYADFDAQTYAQQVSLNQLQQLGAFAPKPIQTQVI